MEALAWCVRVCVCVNICVNIDCVYAFVSLGGRIVLN